MVEDVEIEISCCAFSVILDVVFKHHHLPKRLYGLIVSRTGYDQDDVFGHEGGLIGDAFVGVRDFVFPAYQDTFAFLALRLGADGDAVFDVV